MGQFIYRHIAVAYNMLMCTVFAIVIWNTSMKHVGAAKANLYRYSLPVAATVAGAFFFNEPIWATQIVGGVVIILGLV
ncbi:EamA family transporter, partial [Neobacillus niacini]|uniref:EamA family transporter n=1 Tax=Neobacillus niacini TaxID=86668 RepID=UPI0030028353